MSSNNYKPGGQRRLIFTGNVNTSLFNKYQSGQGIGGLNASVRRAKYRKAPSPSLTMTELEQDFKIRQSGRIIPRPKRICGCMFPNPSNLAFPY
jgi:hypothetical protein|uniref:Uncharacterized protein n=1 Tax=viral metagenome TaxID=1070528 RepID=A0A6C0CHX3_9ZZZZ